MDKEEFRIKLEEINRLVEQKDYKGAMEVVDSIDWRRVKNVRTLCTVGEIYAANKRYEESKENFLLAYRRAPIGKNILYRLVEISLKMGDTDEATEFYDEYREVAPNDNTHYVLKYKILKEQNAPLEEQIQLLEKYKEHEFTEKWSYELAKLYYQAGEKEKCLELCNEIVLWFSEGSYVMRALDLKMRMGELTGAEKEKYEEQFVPKLMKPEDADSLKEEGNLEDHSEKNDHPEIESISITNERELGSVESLQEKISKGIRDIFGSRKENVEDGEFTEKAEGETEVHEEMIRNHADEQELQNVPELEPENKEILPVAEKQEAAVEENDAEAEDDFVDEITSDTDSVEEEPVEVEEISEETVVEEPAEVEEISEEEVVEEPAEVEEISEETVVEEPAETEETPEEAVEEIVEEVLEDAAEETAETEPMKMPTLEIPESMKNLGAEPEVPPIPAQNHFYSNEDDKDAVVKDFNLEDLILAATSAQGVEIPEDKKPEPAEETVEEEQTPAEEEIPVEKKAPVVELEEEEFLSEEDLQEAEAEFLNGPAVKNAPKEEDIPRLEDEDPSVSLFKDDDDEMSEDDFIANMLRNSIGEEDALPIVPQEDEEEDIELEDDVEEELSEEEQLEKFIDSIHPKNPTEIIPRENDLSDDEKKLFTYFVKVPGMKDQLVETLYNAQMAAVDKTSNEGNIIVMGSRGTGKTRLIASLIPAICQELNMEASKVAYVFADQINDKDVSGIISKLSGGFLVIEDANQLTNETVDMLDKAMEFRTDGLIVILEDEKIGMRKFLARCPKFAKKFTSMINIPVFTNDELVNFARVYTKENGFKIDQMGMLALYNLIGLNQKEDQPMNVNAVKEILDTAMAKSQGGLLKFNKKKRVDRDGFMMLHEKDFVK